MRKVVLAFAGVLALCASAEPVRKKIIATGWDTLRIQPSEVLANADKFANSGIDGINLSFSTRNKDGKKVDGLAIFSGFEMEYDDVKRFVPDFQKIAASPGLTESLLTVWWTPREGQRLYWNDNEGWRIVAHNMGVMAKLAKEGGLKGLFLDWEDYSNVGQFTRKDGDPPMEETLKLARQRGREIGNAIFGEFPDLVFFSYWWLCTASYIVDLQKDEREYALKKSVWVAFMDGMFDVMPDGVTMIDGREHYHLESFRRDFYRHSSVIHSGCQALLSPENRAKYRRAISVSYGHYLDMYTNDESDKRWYYGPEGGSRLEHFRRNLEQAFLAADEYVWIYGEKGLFVPFTGCSNGWVGRQKTWEEKLPGYLDVLRKTKEACSFVKTPAADKADKKDSSDKKKDAARPKKRPQASSSRYRQTSSRETVSEPRGELPKKFIATGASIRNAKLKDLMSHAEKFKETGFDGAALGLNSKDSWGNNIGSEGMFSPVKYTVARLRPFLKDMAAIAGTDGLKESLVYISLSPRVKERIHWNSEKRWALFVHNIGLMAKLTKASGIKGFFLDLEDVNASGQFTVSEKEKTYSYNYLEQTARRRGRSVGKAIFTAYPDIVLFASSWFSAHADLVGVSNDSLVENLKKRGSLWPAFVNGILDVMPPTAHFVDGGGNGERDAKKRDYHKAMSDLHVIGRALVDSENFEKYLTALSPAAGETLARYTSASPVHAFWRNLSQAAASSVEYVWIDVGDSPIVGEGSEAIDARMPEWRDVVCQVKDERAWIERYLRENAGNLKDMVPDPTTACGISQGYFAYVEADKRDVSTIESDQTVGEGDSVSFRMTDCKMDGTLMFRVQNVKPDDVYIAQFSTKGFPVMAKVAWRENSEFRWNVPSVGMPVVPENALGWRKASRIIRAPDMDGYNEMYLMIDMRESREKDVSWVDNIHFYKIK